MAENIQPKKRGRPKKNLDVIMDNNIENENGIEKKLTPKKQEIQDYYDGIKEIAKNYFSIVPIDLNESTCTICKKNKNRSDFFRSYSYGDIGSISEIGDRHVPMCKKCAKKIFNYYLEQDKNLFNTLNHWCQTLNLYFSQEIYDAMINLHNSRKGTEMAQKFDYVSDYITALGRSKMINMTYWESPYLQNTDIMKIDHVDDYDEKNYQIDNSTEYPEEFDGWAKEDLENYDYVMEVFRYDPFIDEDLEDRRKLYYNLAGLSSEDILDDFAKANAAIDTCRSMVRLEKLNKLRIQFEKSSDPDIESIQKVTALQKAERQNIALQGKEHGFTQKYNMNKTQGSGTFTGIIKQMDEGMFEDALINAYDIKTSNAMCMAAEASWKAIFSQLNFSESEFSEIVKNQRETIMDLRKENDDLKEKLRLSNIKAKKAELEKRLIEEGNK